MVGETADNAGAFSVSRNIPLGTGPDLKIRRAIESLVERDLGVTAKMIPGNRLQVAYDASRVGIRDIENWLKEAGIAIGQGLGWQMKSAWYAFLDENAKSNARSSGGACCNRPPPGSGEG